MSKTLLDDALIQILHDKPLDNVTVRGICELAEISRSTYYKHYQNPLEQYDGIVNRYIGGCLKIFADVVNEPFAMQSYECVRDVCLYHQKSKDLFLTILKTTGEEQYMERVIETVLDTSKKQLKQIGYTMSEKNFEYLYVYLSASTTAVIAHWLSNDEYAISADQVARFIINMDYGGLGKVTKDDVTAH